MKVILISDKGNVEIEGNFSKIMYDNFTINLKQTQGNITPSLSVFNLKDKYKAKRSTSKEYLKTRDSLMKRVAKLQPGKSFSFQYPDHMTKQQFASLLTNVGHKIFSNKYIITKESEDGSSRTITRLITERQPVKRDK